LRRLGRAIVGFFGAANGCVGQGAARDISDAGARWRS
jgi:hypothetical protein